MPARLRYANALQDAGEVYRSTLIDIEANSYHVVGEADEGNAGYLTRIAKAICATSKHEELCGDLFRCLDWFGRKIVQSKPNPMMADLRGALATLKELYDSKPSESLQFAIEEASISVPDAYQKLKSPCGPVISILRPADPAAGKPEWPGLKFEFKCFPVSLPPDAKLKLSVVVFHQSTTKRYVLPTFLQASAVLPGGVDGLDTVMLPKDLPHGRYRVFFQVSDGDKVISTGHYFVTDL